MRPEDGQARQSTKKWPNSRSLILPVAAIAGLKGLEWLKGLKGFGILGGKLRVGRSS